MQSRRCLLPRVSSGNSGTCTTRNACCQKFPENINKACLKPSGSGGSSSGSPSQDLVCCNTSPTAPISDAQSLGFFNCVEKGTGAVPGFGQDRKLVDNGNRFDMCLKDACSENSYHGQSGSPACANPAQACCVKEESVYFGGGQEGNVQRWTCQDANTINRDLPDNNAEPVRAVCGRQCGKPYQNQTGPGAGCYDPLKPACCDFSQNGVFACTEIGGGANFPGNGNTAPNCLNTCDESKLNKLNDIPVGDKPAGQLACCGSYEDSGESTPNTKYSWVDIGNGDPTFPHNTAPNCIRQQCTCARESDHCGCSQDVNNPAAPVPTSCPIPGTTPTPEVVECPAMNANQEWDSDSCSVQCTSKAIDDCARSGQFIQSNCSCSEEPPPEVPGSSEFSNLRQQSRLGYSYENWKQGTPADSYVKEYYSQKVSSVLQTHSLPVSFRKLPTVPDRSALPPGYILKPCGILEVLGGNGGHSCVKARVEACPDGRLKGADGSCTRPCSDPFNPLISSQALCPCVSSLCCTSPKIWNTETQTCQCPELNPGKSSTEPSCPSVNGVTGVLTRAKGTTSCLYLVSGKPLELDLPRCAEGILDFATGSCLVYPKLKTPSSSLMQYNSNTCRFECGGSLKLAEASCAGLRQRLNPVTCKCEASPIEMSATARLQKGDKFTNVADRWITERLGLLSIQAIKLAAPASSLNLRATVENYDCPNPLSSFTLRPGQRVLLQARIPQSDRSFSVQLSLTSGQNALAAIVVPVQSQTQREGSSELSSDQLLSLCRGLEAF